MLAILTRRMSLCQRGGTLVGILIAVGVIGGLSLVFSQITLNQRKAQQVLVQRRDLTTIQMNAIDVLKNRVVCSLNFQGMSLPTATPVDVTRLMSSATDTFFEIGTDTLYGPQKSLKLQQLQLKNYRKFTSTSRRGTVDLFIVFKGSGRGIVGRTIFRNVLLATQEDGSGNLTSCVAIGTELNRNWSRKIDPNLPNHIYYSLDSDSNGIGDHVDIANLGIGTTDPSARLHVITDVAAAAVAGDLPEGNVYVSGKDLDGGQNEFKHFLLSSDLSLKKEIKPIQVNNTFDYLRGVRFKYKKNDKMSIGVIAQEVEYVFPEAVFTDKVTGSKRVAYGMLLAPLIQSNHEFSKRLDLLNKKIERVEKFFLNDSPGS